MPPTDETPHRHAKKTSHPRRKAKPKFEIPVEANGPESATGWVYRADEVREAHPEIAPETAARNEAVVEEATPNPLLLASMGMFFLGVGAAGLMTLAAIGMVAAPIRFARSIWPESS
jgi:hypothetical protein